MTKGEGRGLYWVREIATGRAYVCVDEAGGRRVVDARDYRAAALQPDVDALPTLERYLEALEGGLSTL